MAFDPTKLQARRSLVIAPHPDDESLGCGGLISVLSQRGTRFHTLFVTDGGASHCGSRNWPRQRLAALREQEAAAALCSLGVSDHPHTFLRLADAAMPVVGSTAWHSAVARVSSIVQTFHPDLVLLPWRRDPHCDHRSSWQLAVAALSRSGLAPLMLEYAIWLEEFGQTEDYPRSNEAELISFDVSPVVHRKQAAIAAHLSQISDLIDDDPSAFRLTSATIARLSGPLEKYWRTFDAAH
jgi:LmbE family N-acetylglucosaminyl deacetylase